MANILAIRFSALGDVAMTMAVLKSFADQHPNDHITLLSRPMASALVERLPSNVHLRSVDLSDYKGLGGLRRLSRELMGEGYDVLVDWHDVLRSKVIRFFFKRAEHKVAVVDKGRKERKLLTQRRHKVMMQLTTSPERYANALADAGYPVTLEPYRMFDDKRADISDLSDIVGKKADGDIWVGIAPFAAHQGKIYPLPLMEEVIRQLGSHGVRVFLFGNGDQERQWCDGVEAENPFVTSLIGKSDLRKELRLINNMDVMVTMDSANMHLSALAGTKTVSIWGATHPFAGFCGQQVEGSAKVQIHELDCRPCSIFGNKKCMYGDYRCMTAIAPQLVVQQILETIKSKK
ncbi:MAG: glycosyltransferase family 9 protein [Bacteroidaceae bacterium]|nr:glycosyltransferase family 9 protein [Bacteroidaceae bacterium]